MEERQRRKLAVILHADVVGSTTLVQRNETLAHNRIQDSFRSFSETIRAYGGLTHELRGDALVAEFARASDAVCAALGFQQEHTESLLALSDDIKPTIRIGISLGEVVFADNTVTGGGVVLAQRVEQLAGPGGLCITAAIHEALPQHMPFDQYDLGEQELKGFEEAIRVYRVALKSGQVVPPPEKDERPKSTNTLRVSVAVATIVLMVAGGLIYWFQPWTAKEEPASVERMMFPLPDRPSIAILPFSDLSESVEHTYIAEGLTENIIATLGKISGLFVIDRGAVSRYNDGSIEARQVSEELGVRYVLKGGVQKSGDRLRVTATLVDTSTGRHIWSERYDRDMRELFSVQDEITGRIVVELQVNLTEGEQARLRYDSTTNFDAWANQARASEFLSRFTKEDNAKARELLESAVDLDPQYAIAWSWLAWTHWIDARFGYSESRENSFTRAEQLAAKSVELDPDLADVLSLLGAIHLYKREYDEALDKGRMAIDLSPNNALNHATFAITTYSVGDWGETIKLLERAMRLSPYYPSWYLLYLGRAQTFKGDYKEAIATHEKGLARAESANTKSGFHAALAFAHMEAGNEQRAREFMAQAFEVIPHYSASYVKKTNFFKDTIDLERLIGALRKAGMPEKPPLKLPDKPSIAVLPFTNMSGDPKQEYLSDAISENIITGLSHLPEIFVIARQSSFSYKGKAVKVQQIAKELGVQYILEGSVQGSDDRVRVTAQLIDASTGRHLWAEQYDRQWKDIFALQDDITQHIVANIGSFEGPMEEATRERVKQKAPADLRAYDYLLLGRARFFLVTKEENAKARELFHKAVELDPSYSLGHTWLAWAYGVDDSFGWSDDPALSRDLALEHAQKAVELDKTDASAHWVLGWVLALIGKQLHVALAEYGRALSLNPNNADLLAQYGWTLPLLGRAEEGVESIEKAMRLNPIHPDWYGDALIFALYNARRYQEALAVGDTMNVRHLRTHLALAGSHAQLGQLDHANESAAKALAIKPDFSLRWWRDKENFARPADKEHHFDGLRKAGLPE